MFDPAQLGGVVGQVGQAYDDLNTAMAQYGRAIPAPSALGSEVASAWSNFDAVWAQELNVLGLATAEVIDKFMTAAQKVAETESGITGAVGQVAG
jgi:hypothetical protein